MTAEAELVILYATSKGEAQRYGVQAAPMSKPIHTTHIIQEVGVGASREQLAGDRIMATPCGNVQSGIAEVSLLIINLGAMLLRRKA